MTALRLETCLEWPEFGISLHGPQCRAGWRKGLDGWLRHLFAGVRCYCPCNHSGMGGGGDAGAGAGASVPERHAAVATRSADLADLQEDWRVIEAATPGPWTALPKLLLLGGHAVYPPGAKLVTDFLAELASEANAAFVARARTRWPAALTEVDALRRVESAAVALLRTSGPGASWGEHETAERVLQDLLKARGHEVGEGAA